jgi:lactoylglutathione lyase
MVRVTDLAASIRFYELLGLREVRRSEHPAGRFTLVFLAAPGDERAGPGGLCGRTQFRPHRLCG